MLSERGITVGGLARDVGVTQPHLWRVLHRQNYKTASADLAGKVAVALGLPRDYWPEYRSGMAIERIKADGGFRDAVFDQMQN